MAKRIGLLIGLTMILGGCDSAQAASCFRTRQIVLPKQIYIDKYLSNGQAGRDLVHAIYRGDVGEAVARLRADPRLSSTRVEKDPALDSQPDGSYGDLLTFAVANCNRDMLKALLSQGLSPDGASRGMPLEVALISDDPMMAEMLLRAGASPDPQKAGGENVFMSIAGYGHIGASMMLIRHGLDVRWQDEFGYTHLHNALAMEQFAIGELLAAAGADLWAPDYGGKMPVHYLGQRAVLEQSDADQKGRAQLIERAKASGFPFPPPNMPAIRQAILAGQWPTPAMKAKGVGVPSDAVIERMKSSN